MVLCDLYLERFNLTKGVLFETSSTTIWYKLCRFDPSVLEFESNELVDTVKNQMHLGKFSPDHHFAAQNIDRQMYCVHIYTVYVCTAL